MTKNIIMLTVVLMLVLPFSAYAAADKTLAEDKWDNFLENANLQYGANDGEFTSNFETARPVPAQGDDQFFKNNYGWTNQLIYSVTNNLAVAGKYDTFSQQSPSEPTVYYTKRLSGIVKDKIIDLDTWKLAAKGDVTYFKYTKSDDPEVYTTFTVNGTVYSNLSLNKYLTLYNNFNIATKKDNVNTRWSSKSITNCVELNYNDRATFRLLAWTSLNHLNNLDTYLSAICRTKITDKITYIVDAQNTNSGISSPVIYMDNLVEVRPLSSTIITGLFSTSIPSQNSSSYLIEARQKLGFLTLKGQYQSNLDAENPAASVTGELKINFTKDFALGFSAMKDIPAYKYSSGEVFNLQAKLYWDL